MPFQDIRHRQTARGGTLGGDGDGRSGTNGADTHKPHSQAPNMAAVGEAKLTHRPRAAAFARLRAEPTDQNSAQRAAAWWRPHGASRGHGAAHTVNLIYPCVHARRPPLPTKGQAAGEPSPVKGDWRIWAHSRRSAAPSAGTSLTGPRSTTLVVNWERRRDRVKHTCGPWFLG